jgi:hypothetical protein
MASTQIERGHTDGRKHSFQSNILRLLSYPALLQGKVGLLLFLRSNLGRLLLDIRDREF